MRNKIEVINLTKIYDQGSSPTIALKNVNFSLEKGYVYAIYGPSGSGKTTLLNILGGLDRPTTGSVFIDGIDICHLNGKDLDYFRNKKIGFIFQFHYLLSEFTVLENILIPYYIISHGDDKKDIINKAKELASILDVSDTLNKYPDYISGGQRQRVAICRALINDPSIVLADEPTGNLDSENTRIVVDLFFKINEIKKTTFIIITHNEKIAERCNKIIELKDGQLINIKENKL